MHNSLPFVNAWAERGLPPTFPCVECGVEVFHTLGREFDHFALSQVLNVLLENNA